MKILYTFRRRSLPFLALSLWMCTELVHAQPGSLQECRAIEDRLARFDCYEMLEADTSPPASQVAEESTESFGLEEEEPAPEERSLFRRLLPFGLGDTDEAPDSSSGNAEPPRDTEADGEVAVFGIEEDAQARLQEDQQGRVEMVDRVAELEMFGHKQWRITLASGQVWTQMLSETFNLREGDEVRISPVERGRYYRLSSPKLAGYIQVRRLQ